MFRLARWRLPVWKNNLIRAFIWKFDVDMSIAGNSEPEQYSSFNEFFTRELKPDSRPVSSDIISPVDGRISEVGKIDANSILQAKGKYYSLKSLLAADKSLSGVFHNGNFITIYLSPKDYHRIHMPVNGRLTRMCYVPGDLFSVNDTTTKGVDNLFARNERLISIFSTEIGALAVIMVGAIFVGSMETSWAGRITPATTRRYTNWNYDNENPDTLLEKGQEMGRFNMGSTVILLFEEGKCEWAPALHAGLPLCMGQTIAIAK